MRSYFTIEEKQEADKMVESPDHLKQWETTTGPRWRVTGESGALALFFYSQYVCHLHDFEHFKRLWKELNFKPE